MKLNRLFVSLVFLTLPLLAIQMSVFAGITGKIAGIITDAETNEPLPSANVIIENTTMGAASDLLGRFTILNVPPGVYTLRVRMMGFLETRVENVRVSIDLTTTNDIKLQQTVLEAGETVTVIAEQPLVQRDMTSSLAVVAAGEIRNLPVESVADVVELQAGVVRDGDEFHIRGGRANEVSFRVDGVNVTDVYVLDGDRNATVVENAAIQELQVVSGTFNAEYGQASSGIINIITKEGQPNYHGRINVFGGDYYSTNDVYKVLSRVDTVRNAATGEIEEVEQLEDPLDELNPTVNTELSLSGPIPGLGEKLTFFLNGRYISREGFIYGRELYTPLGSRGDGSLIPMRERYDYSGLGKLTYRLRPNLKLNYQFMGSKGHNDRSYRTEADRNRRFVPGAIRQGWEDSKTHIFSWTHSLSSNTFYDLRFSALSKNNKSYVFDDPLAMPHYLVNVAEDTAAGIQQMILDPSNPEQNAIFEQLKSQDASYSWIADPNGPLGYVDADSSRAPVSFSRFHAGTDNFRTERDYRFWNAKLDITSQINPSHQIKAGFEAKRHELALDEYTLIAKRVAGTDEEIVPFTPEIPNVSSLERDKYKFKPLELSGYAQDKIEVKDIIVNIGLRVDYFDANATIPTDPRDPDIYRPFKYGNKYAGVPDELKELSIGYDDLMQAKLASGEIREYSVEERKAFMRKEVDAKIRVSPRVGIAFPVTDRGIVHFSYGHFVSMPGLQYLYNDSDYKLAGGNTLLGNPDLAPEKTVHYELGLQQQLGENVGLDVTLFYKDTRGWVGATPLLKTVRSGISYSRYENEDYSNVYGLTFELQKRFAQYFSARLNYTYQLAEGTYSDPNDAYDDVFNTTTPEEPRIALIPMGWDQRHSVNAFLSWRRGGWFAGLTGKFNTGQPYTPAVAKGEITGASSYVGWTANSATRPSLNTLDLRLMRNIRFGGLDFQLYTLIYNLLDQKGEENVYAETGAADFSSNLLTDYSFRPEEYRPDPVRSFNENLRRPEWYQPPREIQVGLAIEF